MVTITILVLALAVETVIRRFIIEDSMRSVPVRQRTSRKESRGL